jgi:Domain of unknown function (DUF6321)
MSRVKKTAESDTATKKNPELWEKAKQEAKSQLGGKWSARAAQLAVQKYKSEGGKYEGKKPSASKNSLVKWTKQDWQTRPGTPEKAERGGVTHRYLPKDKWESLSKKEQVATDRKKVEGDKKGKEIVPNTPAARVKSAGSLAFQHDPSATEPQPEGEMARSRLHHSVDMAGDLMKFIQPGDHLPPWVTDHLTSAHENLSQVHSYIEPKAHESLAKGMKLAGKLEKNPVGADEHRSATGGLTAAGRAHFARTEGANLKPGVKEKNPSGEKAKRKGSFLTRFFTNPRGPMTDEKGRPTRLALSAQAWGETVPKNTEDAHRLAAKGRSLLGKSKEAASYAYMMSPGADSPVGMDAGQFESIKMQGQKFKNFKNLQPTWGGDAWKEAMVSMVDELAKLGTISDEEAAKALERYESLERGTPTRGQVARYAALGAVAGPVIGAAGKAIAGGRAPGESMARFLTGAKAPGALGIVRGVAGDAAKGAISAGAVPLIRQHLDRKAEMGTLREYMKERAPVHGHGVVSPPFEPQEESMGGVSKLSEAGSKSKGLKRLGQLLSGSRVKELRDVADTHQRKSDRAFNEAVQWASKKRRGARIHGNFDDFDQAAEAVGVPNIREKIKGQVYSKMQRGAEERNRTHANAARRVRVLADKEQIAVNQARLGAGAAGAGTLGTAALVAKRKGKEKDNAAFGNTPTQAWDGNGIVLSEFDGKKEAGVVGLLASHPTLTGGAVGALVSKNPMVGALGGGIVGTAVGKGMELAGVGPVAQRQRQEMEELGFLKNASGAPTRGGFMMSSEIPAFRVPPIRGQRVLSPAELHKEAARTAGQRLHYSSQVGKLKHPGVPPAPAGDSPALADQSPTFGRRLPGANKTTIGKGMPKFTPTIPEAGSQG